MVGGGATAVGDTQQSRASEAATAANTANVDSANQESWDNYLLSRGEYAPNTPTGTLPTAYTPENAKLPLWATVKI